MSLSVQTWIMFEAELDCASDDGVSINYSVCLSNEFTVEIEELTSYEIQSSLKGIPQAVLYNGKEVGEYNSQAKEITLIKSALPSTASLLGDGKELIIETSLANYAISVNMYTKIISNKQELDEIFITSRLIGAYDSECGKEEKESDANAARMLANELLKLSVFKVKPKIVQHYVNAQNTLDAGR